MKRLKTLISIALTVIMACGLMPVISVEASAIGPQDIMGSWYGDYKEPYFYNNVYVESYDAYMTITIDKCNENGNFSGTGYSISTTQGSEHDNSWLRFNIAGSVDFETGEVEIKQTSQISASKGSSVSYETYKGTVTGDTMSGLVLNQKKTIPEDLPFSFARVSEWASDEATEANALGLIPATLKGKDLSKPVSRAEFAAIAVTLYETLLGEKVDEVKESPFVDIAGNDDEDAIKKAYSLNITVGVSDTQFAPSVSISREELATMLCRTIKKYKFEDWTYATDSQYYLDSEGVKKYDDDANISDFAKPSVYYMTKLGILKGIDDTHFAPKNLTDEQTAKGYATATREQAVALSLRVYRLSDLWK